MLEIDGGRSIGEALYILNEKQIYTYKNVSQTRFVNKFVLTLHFYVSYLTNEQLQYRAKIKLFSVQNVRLTKKFFIFRINFSIAMFEPLK